MGLKRWLTTACWIDAPCMRGVGKRSLPYLHVIRKPLRGPASAARHPNRGFVMLPGAMSENFPVLKVHASRANND